MCSLTSLYRKTKKLLDTPFFLSFSSKREALEKIICLLEKIELYRKKVRMYEQFWNNAGEIFLLVRRDTGEILAANPTACSVYGYTEEEFLELNALELTSEPECMKTVGAQKLTFVPYREHKTKDGKVFPISATISYFNDSGYDVCAAIVRPMIERNI